MFLKSLSSANYLKVGCARGPHGIRGEVFLISFVNNTDWLSNLKCVTLSNKSAQQIELKIESIRRHKNGFILKTPDVVDRNQAETYKGYEWLAPFEYFTSKPGENIYLGEIEGFKVIEEQMGEVGEITGFTSNGAQDILLVLSPKGVEFQIPLVGPFISEIDFEQGQIIMKLPPGLVNES